MARDKGSSCGGCAVILFLLIVAGILVYILLPEGEREKIRKPIKEATSTARERIPAEPGATEPSEEQSDRFRLVRGAPLVQLSAGEGELKPEKRIRFINPGGVVTLGETTEASGAKWVCVSAVSADGETIGNGWINVSDLGGGNLQPLKDSDEGGHVPSGPRVTTLVGQLVREEGEPLMLIVRVSHRPEEEDEIIHYRLEGEAANFPEQAGEGPVRAIVIGEVLSDESPIRLKVREIRVLSPD